MMGKILIIGSLNMDYVINVQTMPQVGETVLSQGVSLIPGGKGANQAYTVGRLGGQAVMLGAIGCDSAGEALCQSLSSAGVDVSRLKRCETARTGAAFIMVDAQGKNSIIVDQGANAAVDIPYIQENLDILEDCDIVVFQLEIPLETVVFAAKKAKELGKTIILDPAPARKDIPQELYRCVDYLKPNETELAVLTGDTTAARHPGHPAGLLQTQGVKNVVVTLGEQGVFLCMENGQSSISPAIEVPQVIDTTAAGDSFTGAMATALVRGEPLAQAVKFASMVSGMVVTRKGAQTSIPSLKEVEAFQQKYSI